MATLRLARPLASWNHLKALTQSLNSSGDFDCDSGSGKRLLQVFNLAVVEAPGSGAAVGPVVAVDVFTWLSISSSAL